MSYGHLKLGVLSGLFKYVMFRTKAELLEVLQVCDGPIAVFASSDEFSAIVPSSLNINSKSEEPNWVCIRVIGEMPFGTVQGLIATIGTSLKKKKLGMCVVSTYRTDWFFVKMNSLDAVIGVLKEDGWQFDE